MKLVDVAFGWTEAGAYLGERNILKYELHPLK
jgi:hypothetical protein